MADQHQPGNGEQHNAQEPQLGSDMSFPPIGEPEQPETSPESEAEARIRALEERFEQNQQAFNAERERWQQTVDRLIQAQAPRQQEPQQQQRQQQGIDFSDLPDPVDRPDDFKKALAQQFETAINQRLTSTIDQFHTQTTQARTVEQQLNDMWAKFQEDYSDLASKTVTLQGAAMAERNELQRRGVDPQQAMLADPDGFMRRVADRMRSELGMQAPAPQQQQQQQQQQPAPANRTGGVGGGSNFSGGGKKSGNQPSPFSDQLKKFQLDSGLI